MHGWLQVELARQRSAPNRMAGLNAQAPPSKLLTDIGTPHISWCSLAKGMGVEHASQATTCAEFIAQLAAALKYAGPTLIEAVL